MDNEEILNDTLAFESIKEHSCQRYKKVWTDFKSLADMSQNWEEIEPTEEEVMNYIKFLRNEKKSSSSTLWTSYSCEKQV